VITPYGAVEPRAMRRALLTWHSTLPEDERDAVVDANRVITDRINALASELNALHAVRDALYVWTNTVDTGLERETPASKQVTRRGTTLIKTFTDNFDAASTRAIVDAFSTIIRVAAREVGHAIGRDPEETR